MRRHPFICVHTYGLLKVVKGNLKSVNAAGSQGDIFAYYFQRGEESTPNDNVWLYSPNMVSRRGRWRISRGIHVPAGVS